MLGFRALVTGSLVGGSYDAPTPREIGSGFSGGTFSRGRWRKINEEFLARQQEIDRQRRLELEAQAERERLAREQLLRDYIAPIQAIGMDAAAQAKQLHLLNALQAMQGAQDLQRNAIEQIRMMNMARQAAEADDEEEAIALLQKLSEDQ